MSQVADSAFPELSVAPMMDWTDRHCRYFLRLCSPDIRLYTEMVTAAAILRGPSERLLAFDPAEHPVALQLGGSDPVELERAARMVSLHYNYDEINLNVGCPSDRVRSGNFGACLMAEPVLVADCVAAIAAGWGRAPSVKTRIGIDDRDDYRFLADFVGTVAQAGCGKFVVHARKAILKGLSPRQNRSVPPLNYARVHQLKADFPDLQIVINGGIDTIPGVAEHLPSLDGVMIGRKAYADPWFLTALQKTFLGGFPGRPPTRDQVLEAMAIYTEQQMAAGARLPHISRHLLGLFSAQPGAARWRRFITEGATVPGASADLLRQSLDLMQRAA